MDVREKLVELLGGCPCESDCDGVVGSCQNRKFGYCNEIFKLSYCAVSKLAQHLIANGVTVQEWVSTDERMPTQEDAPTEYVFTAYKNQNCYDVGIALLDTVVVYPDLYDYWMALPMPEPPKGDAHNE